MKTVTMEISWQYTNLLEFNIRLTIPLRHAEAVRLILPVAWRPQLQIYIGQTRHAETCTYSISLTLTVSPTPFLKTTHEFSVPLLKMPITIYPFPSKMGTNVEPPQTAPPNFSQSHQLTHYTIAVSFLRKPYSSRPTPSLRKLPFRSLVSSSTNRHSLPQNLLNKQYSLLPARSPSCFTVWWCLARNRYAFNFFIYAHSEELRDLFVEKPRGRKNSVSLSSETRTEHFVLRMTALIEELKDKKFKKWFVSDFQLRQGLIGLLRVLVWWHWAQCRISLIIRC